MAIRIMKTRTTSSAPALSANYCAMPTFAMLVQAYFDCRKHKRNTVSALLFEQDLERNLANKEIFQSEFTGQAFTGDQQIRKSIWVPALKRAKVKYRRPYQTRHTYASMMLSAGESIAWLAEQMGHNDWMMLRKTYAKFIKDSIPDAGEKAVKMFSQKAGKKAGIST